MMHTNAAGEQLDKGTSKGQWQKVYEADSGAQQADSKS
jgi:hypothetical protein